MYDDQPDEPIPPLDRPGVAPWWRVVGIVSLLAAALLLSMVIVLFMALAPQGPRNVNNGWVGGPGVGVGAVVADAAVGDDFLDPANPAYPTRQDLRPAGTFPLPGDPELNPEEPPPSPRQEFRRQVERVAWVSAGPDLPDRVLVSPEGTNMAYAGGDDLMVGPVGAPDPVGQDAAPGVMAPGGRRVRGGVMVAPGQAPRPHNGNGTRTALSGWSTDGVVVAWVGENGRPSQHDMQTKATTHFEFTADALLPLPGADGRLVVVTREPRPKLDGPGDNPHRDLCAVKVLPAPGDDRHPTVLVRPEVFRWDSPALSPDGKRLAIVSDHAEKPGRRRVFILALENGAPKVEPVSPPAERVEGVCWTPDGKELVYARSPSPAPADHAPGTTKGACDLFLLDLESRKETRLSRGGGFTSPSVTKDGELFFLTKVQADDGTASVQLLQMPLKTAREWAEGQEKREHDRTKGWADLAERVWNKAGLGGEPDKVRVSANLIREVDRLYRAEYAAVFKDDAPKDLAALERQRDEVAALDLAPQVRERLALIFGAAEVQSPGLPPLNCAWSTREGAPPVKEVSAEDPFFFAFNPFRPLTREDNEKNSAGPRSLAEVLFRAEGRRLLFSNDPAAAKDQIDRLADADLARGTVLLARDKGDEADRVLLEMTKRHTGNQYLTVHVGTLLYRHGRSQALAKLLDQFDAGGLPLARDPRLYNLLGVALLERDANKAITAFRDALRCDLNYGPAYLNLAQAYQKASRTADARLCLRRYLKLFPEGEWADDARRRLAVAGDE